MRTLVHLSDLHFDRVDPGLIAPLLARIEEVSPDVVVISGDLTQRARTDQFKAARQFLDRLPTPQIVVPGNHDISLHNVFSRFVQPLAKYRRYITPDLEPRYIDSEIAVLGVNTARSLTIKDGRISGQQMERLRAALAPLAERLVKIVVTHHPFDLPASFDDGDLVGRAGPAMRMLSACKADLLLAGHFHTSHADTPSARYAHQTYKSLIVQAGTAISTRGRGEENSFNVIRVGDGHICVERQHWRATLSQFVAGDCENFERAEGGWRARGA